jgi:hypothetical protein
MDVTKNQNLCGRATGIVNALKEAVGADVYNDCLNNPGHYFPADYPGGARTMKPSRLAPPWFCADQRGGATTWRRST